MPKKNHKKSVIGRERESDVRNSSLDFTRRDVLSGAAALSVGVVLPTASLAAKETIVSTIFGGRFEKEYRKAIVDPFQQKYDVDHGTVILPGPPDNAAIIALAKDLLWA